MGTSFKILPKNFLADWGEMESWAQGTGSAPDGWLRGTNPNVQRESTNIKFGLYAALVSGSSGATGGLYRTIPNGDDFQGRTVKLGVWAKSASTGPYIEINDGVTSKTVHVDGSNAYVFTTLPAHKMDYVATQLTVALWASAAATAYYDGAVLCEGEDLFTDFTGNTAISDWSPVLAMQHDQYQISQRDGSFVPETHLQARNVNLQGTVIGSDVASARTHLDEFAKSLLAWRKEEKRFLYLYDDRVAEVFMKNFDWEYQNNLRFISFNISLINPESTTRFLNKLRNRTVISGTVTEFNFAYSGNADSKPVISFIANQGGAITTCQLENLTTGESIVYTGTVPTNVALDIDCDAGTVFNSSVNHIDKFGTSDFIRLVRGKNYFRFSGSNCQINIDYFERFF